MANDPVYLEVIDFICKGKSAEEIIAFRESAAAQRWVEELIERKRNRRLLKPKRLS